MTKHTRFALLILMLGVAGAATAAAQSVTYNVKIDTSSVAGQSGGLDLQFNPGNASSQPATAVVSNFAMDGTLMPPPSVSGSVVGTLPGPLTFTNSTPLNEYFETLTYGTMITFQVTFSGPAIATPNGFATAGSTFGIGLYDSMGNPILTNQGATSGFAGQIDINLNGSTTPTAFPTATGGPSVVTFTLVVTLVADLDGSFQTKIFPNISAGDSVINLGNTGASGTTGVVPPSLNIGGNLCVNVYVFSPDEQEVSCCTCFVTPNGVVTTSVRQLISKTLTPAVPTSVTVKLLSTDGAGGASSCNAAAPLTASQGLLAFGTNLHAAAVGGSNGAGTFALTETPFIPSTISAAELTRITTLCGFINSNGTGFGICPGCAVGAAGASRQ